MIFSMNNMIFANYSLHITVYRKFHLLNKLYFLKRILLFNLKC